MRQKLASSAILVLHLTLAGSALASTPSPLDPTAWGVVYDVPATRDVTLRADVPYLEDARGRLTLDLYLPPGMDRGAKRPAVVFVNAIGDRPDDKLKHWAIYRSWPRLVAAHGIVGVSMEADGERVQDCLAAVFGFLDAHGAEYGIDGRRVGVYAASANVSGTTEYLMGENAAPGIRAAVLYYGRPPTGRLRDTPPVLYIYAEGDLGGGAGEDLTGLWGRVLEARAPWTLLFASDLPHGFDAFSDRDEARRVVQQSLAFWKTHLEPVPQPPWEPSVARTIVEARYAHDDARARELIERWVAEHPEDAAAHRELAASVQGERQFQRALELYEKAYALGDRDPRGYAGRGQILLGTQRWDEAAALIQQALTAGVTSSQLYGQLAYAQLHLGRNADAVRNYEAAFAAGIPPGRNTRGLAAYNLACGYARLGRVDDALDSLARAVNEGLGDRAAIEQDPDLEPLRNDPRYRELVDRLPTAPPGGDPGSR